MRTFAASEFHEFRTVQESWIQKLWHMQKAQGTEGNQGMNGKWRIQRVRIIQESTDIDNSIMSDWWKKNWGWGWS